VFWDSSALVPLLVPEARSAEIEAIARAEQRLTVWWATSVECGAAIARCRRDASFPGAVLDRAATRLGAFLGDANGVAATEELRERAHRLVDTHPLRAGDALQLAAALVWCEEHPSGEGFVCLDARLREAARREGFIVLPPEA
jgi:predicted nucleic acid-binding protein